MGNNGVMGELQAANHCADQKEHKDSSHICQKTSGDPQEFWDDILWSQKNTFVENMGPVASRVKLTHHSTIRPSSYQQ